MSFEQFAGKPAIDILGPFSPHFGAIANKIYSERTDRTYCFMDNAKFATLQAAEINRVMWDEILQRAELCSYLTLERTARLATGAINAYETRNLLVWAGASRSLVESVADSFYVLRSVATSFADNHETIRLCLNGKATDRIVSSKKLENELIHFTHARVLEVGETSTDGHKARSARDYISTINEPNMPDAYEAYRALCNLTHPSAYTVLWMLDNHTQTDEAYSFNFNPRRELEDGQILMLSLKYRTLFHSLLQTTINSSVLALVLCESLGRTGTGTRNIDVSDIPVWSRITEDMTNSATKNIVRVITGFYNKR